VAAIAGAIERPPEDVCLGVVRHLHLGSGQLLAEGDRLPLVSGPAGATAERQADGLEAIRLAGAVRPPQQGDALAEDQLSRRQVAKAERLERGDAHPRGPQTFSRIGITR
jgi:hypothetical protein